MKRPSELSILSGRLVQNMKYFFVTVFLLATHGSLAYAGKTLSPSACQSIFEDVDAPEHSLESFYRKAEARRSQHPYGSRPSFDDANHDRERLNSNFGEDAPDLLAGFLPENVHFIDHVLRDSNGRQVVKDPGSGYFVALRSAVEIDGRHILTNVGVSSHALVANENREQKYLARPEAKAAIISIHGGGTATSGFHVPIALMNHMASYDIDVISLDWPWHGEGPRVLFDSDRQMFDWLNAFIEKNIPPGLPVIIDGHSMGGLISDMINRLTDDPQFKLGRRIIGSISRSPVADAAPGQGLRAKFDAAEVVARARVENEDVRSRFAPIELTLTDELIADGKMHPDGLAHEIFLEAFHSQKIPDHKGQEYKPMLVIVGRHDSLVFVGMEDQFRTNFTSLANVTYVEMVEGQTTAGSVEKVGHLIGDFVKDGEIEQFVKIREWIQDVLGIKLEKANPKGQQRRDTLAAFIQLYSAQLAFREFVASDRVIYERIGTPKVAELNQEFLDLGKKLERWKPYITKRDKIFRQHKNDPAKQQDLIAALEKPEDFDELAAIEARREEINQIRNLSYAPEGENRARSLENLARMRELGAEYSELNKEQKALNDSVAKLVARRKVLLEEQRLKSPDFVESNVELASLRAERDALMTEIGEQDSLFASLIADYYIQLIDENRFSADAQTQLPPAAIEARRRVYELQKEIIAKNEALRNLTRDYALTSSDNIRETFQNLMDVENDLTLAASRMAMIQSRLFMIEAERLQLIKEYVDVLVPGYFSIRQVTMRDVINRPTSDISGVVKTIEDILKDWRVLWNNRSPMGETSAATNGAY